MADESEYTNENEFADPGQGQRSKLLLFLLIGMGAMAVSAAAGIAAARFVGSSSPDEQVAQEQGSPDEQAHDQADQEYEYYDFGTITVNLNEPRLARYIRAALTLAIRSDDYKDAAKLLDDKKPELTSWLILYLSDCTLDEVRGAVNLNRILREILDSFNQRLWPDGKPLIVKVDYKEWAVQ